jgi:type III restriction enzyme
VRAFVDRRVNFNGVNPRELGLEKYTRLAVERLRDAIHPDDSQGEPPLLPILNRYRPVGSTSGVDFPTTRPVATATKSHINAVVLHSGWEKEAAQLLDSTDLVKWHARNDHLGLVIPYEFMGVSHDYEPDFLVRLANDLQLLLEIKGYEFNNQEQINSKHNAARRWVTAVNNLGEFGKWDFLVCRDLDMLHEKLAGFVQAVASASGK